MVFVPADATATMVQKATIVFIAELLGEKLSILGTKFPSYIKPI
jgi:hypothetical protein